MYRCGQARKLMMKHPEKNFSKELVVVKSSVICVFILISRGGTTGVTISDVLKVKDSCVLFNQMVGIYLARTLISDIEKVKFSY